MNSRYRHSNGKKVDFRKMKILIYCGLDEITMKKRMEEEQGILFEDLIELGDVYDTKDGKGKVYYNNTMGNYSIDKDAIEKTKSKLNNLKSRDLESIRRKCFLHW